MLDSLYEVPVEVIQKNSYSDEGDDTDVQLDDDGRGLKLKNSELFLVFFFLVLSYLILLLKREGYSKI
jgi:hypothetical protein